MRAEFLALLVGPGRGRERIAAIERWQKANLSTEAIMRVNFIKKGTARQRSASVAIRFPNGEMRSLIVGPSAGITKAVVEVFASRFLREPAVLLLSQSGEKLVARDDGLAAIAGLKIEVDRNLPDVILVDLAVGQEKLVFVEVVATDGAITPQRRAAFARVSAQAKFREKSVYFVTAFLDRGRPEFRKLIGEIAWDTFVWFVGEPDHLICLRANAQLKLDSLENLSDRR